MRPLKHLLGLPSICGRVTLPLAPLIASLVGLASCTHEVGPTDGGAPDVLPIFTDAEIRGTVASSMETVELLHASAERLSGAGFSLESARWVGHALRLPDADLTGPNGAPDGTPDRLTLRPDGVLQIISPSRIAVDTLFVYGTYDDSRTQGDGAVSALVTERYHTPSGIPIYDVKSTFSYPPGSQALYDLVNGEPTDGAIVVETITYPAGPPNDVRQHVRLHTNALTWQTTLAYGRADGSIVGATVTQLGRQSFKVTSPIIVADYRRGTITTRHGVLDPTTQKNALSTEVLPDLNLDGEADDSEFLSELVAYGDYAQGLVSDRRPVGASLYGLRIKQQGRTDRSIKRTYEVYTPTP